MGWSNCVNRIFGDPNIYRTLLDNSSDPIVAFDPDGSYLYANQAFADGVGGDLASLAGKSLCDVLSEEETAKPITQLKWVLDHKKSKTFEIRISRTDTDRYYLTTLKPIFDDKGRGEFILANSKDITERKQAERVLKLSEEKYRALVETTSTGYLILDSEGTVIDANSEYVRLTGYGDLQEILGKSVLEWTAEYEIERNGKAVAQCARDGFIRNLVIDYVDKNGQITPIEINATVIVEGDFVQIISLCRDITERKRLESEVRYLAYFDSLTQLPNRRMLSDRLSQTIAISKRSGRHAAVLVLDLDNFKSLNDEHGHFVGDLLLTETARRLIACVREVDTVARFGGDEFVVLINGLDEDKAESERRTMSIAEKIRLALEAPYVLAFKKDNQGTNTIEHRCSASIGAALFLAHDVDPSDILKWADSAMYQAKESGRNAIRIHSAIS
jgi:diguanylate cyclase (GGDEF)-like protein/PAS domain S-box-containing protein